MIKQKTDHLLFFIKISALFDEEEVNEIKCGLDPIKTIQPYPPTIK